MFFRNQNQNLKISNKNFKIKFTGNQLLSPQSPNNQIILGSRSRKAIEFTTMSSRIAFKGKLVETESESEACIRDSQISKKVKQRIEYESTNSSAIIKSFDALSCFFDHQVTFKLIFRASNHNFRVSDFHQLCDSYQNTLTLCLTEDSKIIGGFTPLHWQPQFARNQTYFKSDSSRQTFLFSVTNNAKYPLAKALKNKAICCFDSYGPTFGGGYDLLIGDKTNQVASSSSYFPRNFELTKGTNFNKHDFTGTNRKSFKLHQWQVFSVSKVQDASTMERFDFATQPTILQKMRGDQSWLKRFKTCARQLYNKFCRDW